MRKVLLLTAIAALSLSGCELFEKVQAAATFSLGSGQGIKPISATYTVDIPQDFKCGAPITGTGYTVETKANGANCEFNFRQEITVMGEDAYTGPHSASLKAIKTVKSLDINVTSFAVTNGVSGAVIDLATSIADLDAKVYEQQVLTKAMVAKLPAKTSISGDPLNKLKAQIAAKQPVILPVAVFLSVPTTPAPPEKLTVSFVGQPAFVIGL